MARHTATKTGLSKRLGEAFNRLFCKRSIIIIAEHKTQHVPVSVTTQLGVIALVLGVVMWGSFSTGSYMAAQKVLQEKDKKLATKTIENERIGAEFSLLRRDLMKLVDAGKSGKLAGDAKLVVEQYADKDTATVDQIGSVDAGASEVNYNEVFARIEFLENKVRELQTDHDTMISEIKTATSGKIKEFDRIIAMTGLNREALERQAKTEAQKQQAHKEKYGRIDKDARGGPFIPVRLNSIKETDPTLYFDMQRMMTLSAVVASIPLDNPLKQYVKTTSSFGTRIDPFSGRLAFHSGVDLAGPVGTGVYASNAGRVTAATWKGAYGNAVDVEHGLGFSTRYGHLRSMLVRPGQMVKKGQLIGVQGSTGRSTGNHLHYEVRLNDRALNPANFLKAGNYVRTLD